MMQADIMANPTQEEWSFLEKRRAIPATDRELLDVMLETAYKRIVPAFQQDEIEVPPADPFYSEANMERLKKSICQMERGEVVTKTMDELRALANG